ncbi:Crp/Fnr family transcriptional regulator [Rhabdobacter roseus]|uniref:CRP-like cAMP-binding protein n=2 Tax=Rhabdobacter roseus TaxID=1655419 RepID=A0A840TWX2_9BACT|nr:CRP-like cAMP-binding protein [Rhabdobacter roseus]
MSTQLVDYFARLLPLTDAEAKALAEESHIETFAKGTLLLRAGQVARECYFVLQGCVRQYYLVEGEERTTQFFTEEQWVVSLKSFAQQVPADHYFVCNENTTLVVGTAEKENQLYRRFPKFETLSRTVLERNLAEQQEMTARYLTDTPEQRYLYLLTSRPELLQRVPQYQLASYLGVKPESLSRIRKRMARRPPATPVLP